MSLFKNKYFIIGLIIKVICSFLFAGQYLKEYFHPFIVYFVESGFSNPYTYFQTKGITEAFPYPAGMLYFLSFFSIIGNSSAFKFFLIRLPLLLADLGILILLEKLLKGKKKKILLLYWLSPVLFYITYLHGQLDVLPIMILFLSFYFLFKKKKVAASLFLCLALATKTNIALVIPFFLLYLYSNSRKKDIRTVILSLFIIIFIFLIINSPFILSEDFYQMVFNNKEQIKLWSFNIQYNSQWSLYVIPFLYILSLAKAIRYEYLSKDLFIMFIGFVFSLLLLFIPPKPGWYFWILPFLIYFYVKEDKLTLLPFISLQFAYLLYFFIVPSSDYFILYNIIDTDNSNTLFNYLIAHEVNPEKITNLVFTGLQTLLFLNIYWIYKRGISNSMKARIKNTPYLIGIGGDSGAGKSTITKSLENLFSIQNITIIRGDDMHKWERGHKMWEEHTHLSPKANNLHQEINQIKQLKSGKKVLRRHYDHNTGHFTEPLPIYSNKVIVFEGLHPFYIAAKRELFDIKIFVEPDEDLRINWKVKRDIEKRGYDKKKILNQLKFREEDSKKYIKPQGQFADVKLSYYSLDNVLDNNRKKDDNIGLKISCGTNIDLHEFCKLFSEFKTIVINHGYDSNFQYLLVEGEISKIEIQKVFFKLIKDNDILDQPILESDFKGFIQLFILHYVQENII